MRLGTILVLLVTVGTVGVQIVGMPTAIGHAYSFMWRFGWPRTYFIADGLQRDVPIDSDGLDSTDTDWITRTLVPVIWNADRYGARTSPLIARNTRALTFRADALLVDLLHVLASLAAALYLRHKLNAGLGARHVIIGTMAVLGVVCAAYYAYVIMTWPGRIFFAFYQPIVVALNGLAVTAVLVASYILARTLIDRAAPRGTKS